MRLVMLPFPIDHLPMMEKMDRWAAELTYAPTVFGDVKPSDNIAHVFDVDAGDVLLIEDAIYHGRISCWTMDAMERCQEKLQWDTENSLGEAILRQTVRYAMLAGGAKPH